MTHPYRRSTAAVAVTGLVAVLLPLFTAGHAAARSTGPEPTAVTVYRTTAYAARNGSAVFAGRLVGASGAQAHGVFFAVTAGPDADPVMPLAGTACQVSGGDFSCTVAVGNQPGVDTVRFFYDAAGTATYQAPDQSVTGALTIGGAPSTAPMTPTSARTGSQEYQAYQVQVADAAGRPVTGATVSLSATGTNAVGGTLAPGEVDITATKPAPGSLFTGMGTASATGNTADGSAGTAAGIATFWVASAEPGFVVVHSSTGSPAVVSSVTLTVDPVGVNDATSVQIIPATQKAFTNGAVQQNITVLNTWGDPVPGVTPSVVLTGADDGQFVTVGSTDGTGTAVASYNTLGIVGADQLVAYVNQSNHTVTTTGLDPGEPSGHAAVTIVGEHFGPAAITSSGAVTVPAEIATAPVTFTLTTNDGSTAAGYTLNLAVSGGSGASVLSVPNAVTDAAGKVTVTVTNSSPSTDDTATVTATLVGDNQIAKSETVTWVARAAIDPIISPYAKTSPTKGTSTHTASITDQFGGPIAGVTFSWLVQGRNDGTRNTGATGTGSSFTYTDTGRVNVSDLDTVTVTALNAAGGVIGTDTVVQYWVTGTALADQANIDAEPFGGTYLQGIANGPYVAANFTKSTTVAVTSDPTPAQPVTPPHRIAVKLIDANGNPLFGKVVHFTSTGVGGFTNPDGKPIGSTATALVADGSGANGEQGTLPTAPPTSNPTFQNWATVFVRSTSVGSQYITATVDGITDTATVTYTGDYVPVNPLRVLDSRTGQGGLYSDGGGATAGLLAPNTTYYFYYGNTDLPRSAAAYAFNVTAIHPSGSGYLRLSSACYNQQAPPTTSLINYQAGKDIANFVVISVGCGNLQIMSSNSSAGVAIDMVGYYPARSGANIQTPTESRIADTRSGFGGGSGPVRAGVVRTFQIAGRGGVAVGAKAAALNLTAIDPSGGGHLRVYPDGAPMPNTSIANYIPGMTKAAFTVVDLPPNGRIDVYSADETIDLTIDAFAYYPTSSNLVTGTPVRILDTRHGGTLAANTARNIQVTGLAGVPADAQAVLVTVTSIHTATSTGGGNLRIYPAGQPLPNVSTLNYVSPTSEVANFTIVKPGVNGQMTLYSAGSAIDVAVDVLGYVPAGGSGS